MSWICKRCETENPDTVDVCEVCETHAPMIVDFQYDKVLSGKPIMISWKTEYCESVSIFYKGETIDVPEEDSYSIDKPDESNISFILSSSETTPRTVNFTMDFIEPPTISFSSDKLKLRNRCKEQVTLTWSIKNAKKAFLITVDNKIEIPLTGKQKVCLDVTTWYIIKALALDNESTFEEKLQIGFFDECIIDFRADKYYIYPSIPVVLSWKVDKGWNVKLDGKSIEEEGTKIVEPEKATSYTITAEDEFGTKEKRIDIKMLPIPQVKALLVSTPKIGNNLSVAIQQPRYTVDVKFPTIDIDWIKVEVPRVKSLTELGLNRTLELSPPMPKFSLMSSIKRVFNHIIKK